jgi:hypothetical protein
MEESLTEKENTLLTPASVESGFDSKAAYMNLLLSEKEYADKRIGAYIEIQAKITAIVFPVVIAALGWIFTQKDSQIPLKGLDIATLCLLICVASSIVLLISSFFNSYTLMFISYKIDNLGHSFKELLDLDENPLASLEMAVDAPARRPIMFASILLVVAQSTVTLGALCYALTLSRNADTFWWLGWFATAAIVFGAVVSQLLFLNGLKKVKKAAKRAIVRGDGVR